MLFAARSPIRVGIVPWPDRPNLSTVVVKLTYDVVSRASARLGAEQRPLQLDIPGDEGVVLHPTDFAPTKGLCDVVVVGAALLDPVGPARLAVDPVRKLVELPRDLGPRPGFGASGDPTDAKIHRAWGSATFDFDSFQCAPRDQRRPCTPLPVDVVYDLGATRVVTRIEGPAPGALLLDLAGWNAPRLLTLLADTILIDPENGQISVVFRGVVDVPEGCDPLLVMEAQAPLRSFSPREMERWPRAEAIDPSLLRRLQGLALVADGGPELGWEEALGTTARFEVRSANVPETSRLPSTVRVAVAHAPPEEEAPETTPTMATGPRLSAPPRVPSFGAPPPLVRTSDAAIAPPAAPLPKASLGGLMMLPLETRAASTPPIDLPAGQASTEGSASQALHGEAPDDDPLAGTMQDMVPAELRRPAIVAVPSGAPGPGPAVSALATSAVISRALTVPDTADAEDADVLGTSTVSLQVPAELRREALPFGRTARPSDEEAPTDRPTSLAGAGAVAAPPPLRVRRDTLLEEDLEEAAAFVGSVEVPAQLRALPFVARPSAPPPPVSTPATRVRDGLPFGSRTGTLISEVAGLSPFHHTVPLPVRPPAPVPRTQPPLASPATQPEAPPLVAPPLGRFSTGDTAPPPPMVAESPKLPTAKGDAPVGGGAVAPSGPRMLTREEFAEIRAALWARTGGRRELLAKRGFSEIGWRLAERKFMKSLADQPKPDRILAMVTRLQEEVRRGAVPTDDGRPA